MATTKVIHPIEIERDDYYQEWRENRFFEISSALCEYCEIHCPQLLETRDSQVDMVTIMMDYIETPQPFLYSDRDMQASKADEEDVWDP
jgi:hypothetical protein